MKTHWKLNTYGDPLGAIREFVHKIWERTDLELLLVLVNGEKEHIKPQVLRDPQQLENLNPFTPLMPSNAAKLVPELLTASPEKRIGVLLRPCEMRALVEMTKHDSFTLNDIVSVCVDCLGTFPEDEYQWRANRKRNRSGLAGEAIQFARHGGIVPYRYRSACQICPSPEALGADLNIGVLGLPVRQHLLVDAGNGKIAQSLKLEQITDGMADTSLVEQHRRMIAKLNQRNSRTRERVIKSLSEVLPSNVDDLITHLENCGQCQDCLDNCPICSVDYPKRSHIGKYDREDIKRWLISCSGCGMCEQTCPSHLPLSIMFGYIHEQIAETYNYSPGRSIEEPLPIM